MKSIIVPIYIATFGRMNKKMTGIALLKRNFNAVEARFQNYFEKGEPRWPSEKRDYLHNHHQSLDNFYPGNITLDKLKVTGLPEDILQEMNSAFEAFKREEEYGASVETPAP